MGISDVVMTTESRAIMIRYRASLTMVDYEKSISYIAREENGTVDKVFSYFSLHHRLKSVPKVCRHFLTTM